MCIALGIEIGFTRQPTFQYPPHLVSPHALPLFLFLSFPFFHLYLYLSLSPVFLFPLSFVLVWRFCLFATPLLLVLNIRIGPVFLRLPSHIPPLYPQRIPAATQQSPTNSIAFPTLFILDRLVSARCFPCNDLYDLVSATLLPRLFLPPRGSREKRWPPLTESDFPFSSGIVLFTA